MLDFNILLYLKALITASCTKNDTLMEEGYLLTMKDGLLFKDGTKVERVSATISPYTGVVS